MPAALTTIPRWVIKDALEETSHEDLRVDYPGRGMYGADCLAIALADGGDLGRFMFGLGVICGELGGSVATERLDVRLRRLVRAARVDSMGIGIVAYFPSFTLEQE